MTFLSSQMRKQPHISRGGWRFWKLPLQTISCCSPAGPCTWLFSLQFQIYSCDVPESSSCWATGSRNVACVKERQEIANILWRKMNEGEVMVGKKFLHFGIWTLFAHFVHQKQMVQIRNKEFIYRQTPEKTVYMSAGYLTGSCDCSWVLFASIKPPSAQVSFMQSHDPRKKTLFKR